MNNLFETDVQAIKNKALSHVAKLAYENELTPVNAMKIPNEIIPDDAKPTMRCCIYKERAILAQRVQVAMGGDINGVGVVQVLPVACDECPSDGIRVTESCRGCLAHRCLNACPRNAIKFDEKTRRAVIDKSLCVECGRCAAACSYGAIIKHERPCVKACKPGALTIDRETQKAVIDENKCISCGHCVYQCPFGAVVDKSFITKVVSMINESENNSKFHVYAIIAPAIAAQYDHVKDVTLEKVVTGIKALGFHTAVEAAWGADLVAVLETKELAEKGFLTSSCCPAFVNYIHKNFAKLVPHISHNLSPMAQMGKILKKMDPGCKTVFVGPCIAKKSELERGKTSEYIDAVITFEELQALFDAKEIDLTALEETPLDNASYYGRIFARIGGLSEAVGQALKELDIKPEEFTAKPIICNGITECKAALMKANVALLKNNMAMLNANFIEGMCCEGGCIGGPACLNHLPKDAAEITKYGKTAVEQTIKSAISVLEGYEEVK
ncbi:MAG: 4Fe-4S dicluster domain-containing protein [Oscillospiraceae bacterium]|nr:4Fe-4S dicluster domain-containing protein [Oscillospiraceae bacterium]